MAFYDSELRAEKLAAQQLLLWRSWGAEPSRADAYLTMVRSMPEPSAAPNFAFARALLQDHRALAPVEKARPDLDTVSTEQEREAYFSHGRHMTSWAQGTALAMRDAAWGWDKSIVFLREQALSTSDDVQATELARQMAAWPEAPWRRWACASPIAEALLAALDQAGQREPAIASLGAASLASLMGFGGLACSTWIKTIAESSTPDGFVADVGSESGFHFVQQMLARHDDIAPSLPVRKNCAEDFSRALDVMDLASQAPAMSMCFQAMGMDGWMTRPAPSAPLAAAQSSSFAQSCLSNARSGLPAGFDRAWPISHVMSLMRGAGVDPLIRMSAAGGSLLDIYRGEPLWESAIEPIAEQGSEGYFAPIDDALMEQVVASGADLRHTELGRRWARSHRRPEWNKDCSLTEFYTMVLDPPRATHANEIAGKWVALCEKIDIEAATALGSPKSKARAL
jgi:hypothetical protein